MTGRKIAVATLRVYKSFISPMLPPACRFQPTCSVYAAEAIEIHGVLKGAGLALLRIARCHPWSRGGFDPVPDPPDPARAGNGASVQE